MAAGASSDEQPEVDISDEEFLQFDTSAVPVIITLTEVSSIYFELHYTLRSMKLNFHSHAGWEALYCGCNSGGGIPYEFGHFNVC